MVKWFGHFPASTRYVFSLIVCSITYVGSSGDSSTESQLGLQIIIGSSGIRKVHHLAVKILTIGEEIAVILQVFK